MIALTALLVLAGCTALALSQERNWKIVAGVPAIHRTQMAMRFAGGMLLLAALAILIAVEGASFAVLTWVLQIAVASVAAAMTLSFRPRLLGPIARAWTAGREV